MAEDAQSRIRLGWFFIDINSVSCTFCSFLTLLVDLRGPIYLYLFIFPLIGGLIMAMRYIFNTYSNMPYHSMGAKARFMVELIPLITVATVRHVFIYSQGCLWLVTGCTFIFYSSAHNMHIAYDIGLKDVLLEVVMLHLVYYVGGGLLTIILVLSFSVALCIYRYRTYCAPHGFEADSEPSDLEKNI